MKLKDFDFRIWNNNSKTYEAESITESLGFVTSVFKQLTYKEPTIDYEIEIFTGYFDKNGNKIYENDILMNELTEEIFYITRDDTYKMSEIILYGKDCNGNLYRKRNSGGINLLKMLVSDKNMSVVGNIHENPELLEEGKQWKLANLES
ncbi:TPA: YopX family protein [Campylobacter jejuni]